MKKNVLLTVLILILILDFTNVFARVILSNDDVSNEEKNNQNLSYAITKKVVLSKDKDSIIFYPQMQNYRGELFMSYMNQSLKKITNIYLNSEVYTNVELDYEIKKKDEKILSILFTGTAKVLGTKEINIKQSVNLDIKSTNEITYFNLIKDDKESKENVLKILNNKAKAQGLHNGIEAEGIRIYFEGDNVIFYYMPLDDSAKEFVEVIVPFKEMQKYASTYFGEHPAS